jgi:hypothetical protein
MACSLRNDCNTFNFKKVNGYSSMAGDGFDIELQCDSCDRMINISVLKSELVFLLKDIVKEILKEEGK